VSKEESREKKEERRVGARREQRDLMSRTGANARASD
jgi:hypothetical protein